ncbi:MAG: histidine triad nucleotide-binding protein [Planctomycetes bacterium]|nr:histidine triad nucleotide-binding protein [Planctomycetota bacterium]
MSECLFCRMVSGDLKVPKVYEDPDLFAINDIHPQAPVHILLIPRRHRATILDLDENDQAAIGKLFSVASRLARDKGLDQSGYRIVVNCLEGAGQSVFHVHFHLLGGRPMRWPPG